MDSVEIYIKEQYDKINQNDIKIQEIAKEKCMHKRKSNATCESCIYNRMKDEVH